MIDRAQFCLLYPWNQPLFALFAIQLVGYFLENSVPIVKNRDTIKNREHYEGKISVKTSGKKTKIRQNKKMARTEKASGGPAWVFEPWPGLLPTDLAK